MGNKSKKFSTKCVHEGEIKDTMYQGIVSPLFSLQLILGSEEMILKRNPIQDTLILQIKNFYQKKLPH